MLDKKARVMPSGINPGSVMRHAGSIGRTIPQAGMGASAALGAGKGILGGLLFGFGANMGANLTAGSFHIMLAIIADIVTAAIFATGGSTAMFVILALGHYFIIFNKFKGDFGLDRILIVALILNLLPIALKIISANYEFGIFDYEAFRLTPLGNGIFPIWLIYAGFFKNRGQGLLSKAVYILFFLGFAGWAINEGVAQGAYSDIAAANPEEIGAVEQFFGNLIQGVVTSGKGTVNIIKSAPDAIGNTLSSQVGVAGGEELFGESEERPKLGVTIQNHPRGFTEQGGAKIAKAILLVENRPAEQPFIEVSNVICKADEFEMPADEFQGRTEPVKLFYNVPMTVTCTFTEENYPNNLAELKAADIVAEYGFETNARLVTYAMRADLLEELRLAEANPLDFMAVPPSKRRPRTLYDNGPAKIGIGPVELLNPPLGVPLENSLDFELVIGNQADFGGEIAKIKEITIQLPAGITLDTEDPRCPFEYDAEEGAYRISDAAREEKKLKLETIKTSRLFTCGMLIAPEAVLGNASFAEVEFDVTVPFTYETRKRMSLR